MTLYELLANEMSDNVSDSARYFMNNDNFYKSIGRAHMCRDLIELLSDETLRMEVTTRTETMAKGDST